MNTNSANPQTPNQLFSTRCGFNIHRTPFISPLILCPSPMNEGNNIFDKNQPLGPLNDFRLQEEIPLEELDELEQSSYFPVTTKKQKDLDFSIDETNMLEFVLDNINKNQTKMDKALDKLTKYGNNFNKNLFIYLDNKFRQMKKTKEEMVKYCVRKSFKMITNNIRQTDKAHYIDMENYEIVAEYFQKHCEGDTSISIPFKKNSQVKTMNTIFLTRIFQCRQYNIDYKQFLQQFPQEYNSDNRKKIKSMNEVIKKCVKTKSYKGLNEYVRLPWTSQLLDQINQFAQKLFVDYSSFKNQSLVKENKRQSITNKVKKPLKEAGQENLGEKRQRKYEDEFIIIRGHPKIENDNYSVLEKEINPFSFINQQFL